MILKLSFGLLFFSPLAYGQTFIYCSESSPSAFNPQVTSDGTSINATLPIYNTLVSFAPGGTEIVPSLAQSWSISQDHKTYTFNLRKGVKFHKTKDFSPTRDFGPQDVIFSFERMRDSSHPYHFVGGGRYEYFQGMGMDQIIQSLKAKGPHTIEITLTAPEAPFLANLAMPFMSILSQQYAQLLLERGRPEDLDFAPVGTGPFIFKSYRKGAMIRFEKNSHYWGPSPKIEKLVFSITPGPSVRYQKLKRKECHLIIDPSPPDLASMEKDPRIKLLKSRGPNVAYLAINTSRPPWGRPRLRRALAHALNRRAYIKAIYLGHAEVAHGPIPPTLWPSLKTLPPLEYDPQKARDLLRQEGLHQGLSVELWALSVTRAYNPQGKKMGEMMKADLKKVGIEAEIVQYDWPTYLKKTHSGQHELAQMGWMSDNGDPDNFLGPLLSCRAVQSGSNLSRWCHKDFDSLINQARSSLDPKRRVALYNQALEIFHQQLPWIPLAHAQSFRAMVQEVSGYVISPLGIDLFDAVELR